MTNNNREVLRRRVRAGCILSLWIALLAWCVSGYLYAASETEKTAGNANATAAAIADLRAKIQGELDRIEAVEHKLETIENPGSAPDEVTQLKQEIRSERARIEAMESSLNELSELTPPPAAFPAAPPSPQATSTFEPTLSVGAGIRTDYQHSQITGTGGSGLDQFLLNDARLYFSGDITKNISAMFNTDYNSSTNSMQILDAVGEFHVGSKFNVWFGRFLPPSDRANLYGPFYANEWRVYTDGIQDGYPAVFQGRDNGAAYWGDFMAGKTQIKIATGAFDGFSVDGDHTVIGAARVQLDFWDPEGGYYLNGTYYGDKNLLALGGATQWQGGKTATTLDFLMEKKMPNDMGAITIESEYSDYNRFGGYDPAYAKSQGAYALASYIFPKEVGIGKFEILGKYAIAEFTHGFTLKAASYRQNTAEVNFNYIIKEFDARIQSFYEHTDFNVLNKDTWVAGVGLQFQLNKQIH